MIYDGGQQSYTRRLYHSPGDSNQCYIQIQRLHYRKRLVDRGMERHLRKTRYQSLNFLQEILFFFIRYLLSFSEHVKRIFLHLLYLNEDYKSTHDSPFKIVYHYFEVANASPYCIGDPEQDPNDNHSQASKNSSQKTTVMIAS